MFSGIATALVTPFRKGKIDLKATEALVKRQLAAGVDALVVAGTTGEASALTQSERILLTEAVCAAAGKNACVIAGAGSNVTEKAVRLTKDMQKAGAKAVLCVTPYYNRCNQEGLKRHYLAVADASEIPVILYNVPKRTGVDTAVETVCELFKHPMIRGVKEASGDFFKIARLLNRAGSGYVYAGDDQMILPMMAMGASGGISVLSNVYPREMKRITDCALRGDYASARRAHDKLFPKMCLCARDVNPIPVKGMLSIMGLMENELRLPLTACTAELMKEMEREMAIADAQ